MTNSTNPSPRELFMFASRSPTQWSYLPLVGFYYAAGYCLGSWLQVTETQLESATLKGLY